MQIPRRRIQYAFLTGVLFILFSAPLYPQTADKLEALLEKPELSWSETADFILEASDIGVFSSTEGAFRFAEGLKWLPKKAGPGDIARLNGVALLLMRSFDLKGGIFYSLAKSPHHAYRELIYKGYIRGSTDPDMTVSGRELLLIVNRILAVKEKETEKAVKS